MTKKLLFLMASVFLASSAFAEIGAVSELHCTLDQVQPRPDEQAFSLNIRFHEALDPINDSGLARRANADLTVSYLMAGKIETLSVNGVILAQEGEFHGSELRLNSAINGSEFNSFFMITPEIKKSFFSKSITAFKGEIELNAKMGARDGMIVKSERLSCQLM